MFPVTWPTYPLPRWLIYKFTNKNKYHQTTHHFIVGSQCFVSTKSTSKGPNILQMVVILGFHKVRVYVYMKFGKKYVIKYKISTYRPIFPWHVTGNIGLILFGLTSNLIFNGIFGPILAVTAPPNWIVMNVFYLLFTWWPQVNFQVSKLDNNRNFRKK